jgi:hypothetical protein
MGLRMMMEKVLHTHTHTAHQQEFDIIYMQLCIQQEERETRLHGID